MSCVVERNRKRRRIVCDDSEEDEEADSPIVVPARERGMSRVVERNQKRRRIVCDDSEEDEDAVSPIVVPQCENESIDSESGVAMESMSCVVERNRKRRRIVCDDSEEDEDAVSPIVVPQREDEGILVDSDEDGGDGSSDESEDDFIVDDRDDDEEESEGEEEEEEEEEESDEDEEEEACESCSSDSESGETEDSVLASKLLRAQASDSSDAGYGLMAVLNAISTAKYKTLNASESSHPIPVSSKLGVCLSDGMRSVFKDFIALKAWMELVGVAVPEEIVLCILQKTHSALRSESPLSGLYVVSIDPLKVQNYRNHLLPILLAATGVKVVAEVEHGEFLTEPYLTGFVQFRLICFGKGCYGSVGCFCRQKELGKLYGVRHNKSGVVFFVGSSCVCNFNQSVDDAWETQDVHKMPSYLHTVHEVGLDGLVVFGVNNVSRRLSRS